MLKMENYSDHAARSGANRKAGAGAAPKEGTAHRPAAPRIRVGAPSARTSSSAAPTDRSTARARAPGEEVATQPHALAHFASAWDELVLALRRLQARGALRPGELSLSQYYLLLPLARSGPLALGRLAEAAGVAAPTVTRMIDSLEAEGLVQRSRSPSDRRAIMLQLTDRGRQRMHAKRRFLAHRRKRLYERLDPAERAGAARLLAHLAELLGEL
jgi:DNA-binding MarR family transcriptional regulator